MKQSKLKNLMFAVSAFAVLLLVTPVLRVGHAEEDTQKGSISMVLAAYRGQDPMAGAEITIYRVGFGYEKDGEAYFELFDEYAACPVDFDGDGAAKLEAFVNEGNFEGITGVTDEEGAVSFDDLELGLYLITQSNEVKDFSRMCAFFVSVPQISDTKTIYDVNAEPKVEVEVYIDLAVRKIWNDNGKEHPETLTVALKKGGEIVERVVLSAENDWHYVWKHMPKSDEWSVEELEVPAGYLATYRRNEWSFIIENTPKLVQTGQLKWPIPVLAGTGVVLLLLGIYGWKKEK